MRTIRYISFLFCLLFPFQLFCQEAARTKPTEGTCPLRWFEKKPLPIGTPVWTNLGDTLCAYPETGNGPDITPKCFGKYNFKTNYNVFVEGIIVGVELYKEHFAGKTTIEWLYILEFDWPAGGGRGRRKASTWWDAYKMVNINDERVSWSRYIVTLNW